MFGSKEKGVENKTSCTSSKIEEVKIKTESSSRLTHKYHTRSKVKQQANNTTGKLAYSISPEESLKPGVIINLITKKEATYKQLIQGKIPKEEPRVWKRGFSNELGHLARGIRDITGTDTLRFIRKSDVPGNKKVTYGRIVCDYRPFKPDPFRVHLCVGGDKLEYEDDTHQPTADLITFKLLVNDILSTNDARAAVFELKTFIYRQEK